MIPVPVKWIDGDTPLQGLLIEVVHGVLDDNEEVPELTGIVVNADEQTIDRVDVNDLTVMASWSQAKWNEMVHGHA